MCLSLCGLPKTDKAHKGIVGKLKKEITMTVKELKKLLEDVDDELELVGYQNGL